MLNTLLNE